MKETDKEVELDKYETVGHCLEMLECDAYAFLRECEKHDLMHGEKTLRELADYFLLNMYKSVNFWVGAIKGKNVCFNHDDKKHPNRVIKFDHSEDTIRNFLFNAWDHIAHAINKQWYTQQLEELT